MNIPLLKSVAILMTFVSFPRALYSNTGGMMATEKLDEVWSTELMKNYWYGISLPAVVPRLYSLSVYSSYLYFLPAGRRGVSRVTD
jgi:hypothetical protein